MDDEEPPEPWKPAKDEAELFRQDAAWEDEARRRVDLLLSRPTLFDRWRELVPWREVVKWKLARR